MKNSLYWIKNRIAIVFFITFVTRHIVLNKTIIKKDINSLMTTWKKKRELGKELFFKPSTLFDRMNGDCDDFVTLMAIKLKQEKKQFKIGFAIRNSAAYHVFIVLTDGNILLDPWISTEQIKYKRKIYSKADRIVFPALFRTNYILLEGI